MKFLTAGDSHGEKMICIIEGFPSGVIIDEKIINNWLSKRRNGKYRSNRMKLEDDKYEIISGIYNNKTTGFPIGIIVYNRVKDNRSKYITPRPGHADLGGILRYGLDDIRPVIERASGRETVLRTIIGAICYSMIKEFGVSIKEEIKITQKVEKYDSIGGSFKLKISGLVPGLGTISPFYKRLNSRLFSVLSGINAIKGLIIGENPVNFRGSEYNGEWILKDNMPVLLNSKSGGIDGGITNGNTVNITGFVRPVPTIKKGVKTFDIQDKNVKMIKYERSDNCIVDSVAIVAKAMTAFVFCDILIEQFGYGSLNDIKKRFFGFIENIKMRWANDET